MFDEKTRLLGDVAEDFDDESTEHSSVAAERESPSEEILSTLQ